MHFNRFLSLWHGFNLRTLLPSTLISSDATPICIKVGEVLPLSSTPYLY